MDIPEAFTMPTKSLPIPDATVNTSTGKVGRWYPDGWIIVADHAGVELLPHAGSASLKSGTRIDTVPLVAALSAAHQWHQHRADAQARKSRAFGAHLAKQVGL